jgi:hypothetical protein
MKTYKKLLINIVISLILQAGILYYINTYFLTPTVPFTSTEVNIEDQSGIKRTRFKLPSSVNSSSIKISDDAMYMAYIQNDSLKVMNVSTGKVRDISDDGMIISDSIDINGKKQTQPCFEWVPNRDRLIVGYISKELTGRSLKLISYDPVYNQKQENENLPNVTSGRYITQIQASPITGAFYIKTDGNNNSTSIFRIDRDGKENKLITGVNYIEKMTELQNEDTIYYENSKGSSNGETTQTVVTSTYGHKRYVYRKNSTFDLNGIYTSKFGDGYDKVSDSSSKLKIIGVNEKDQAYFAKFDENDKLVGIYHTSVDEKGLYPYSLPMEFFTSSLGVDDIFIVPNKGLCINDRYLHKFTELNTKKVVTYSGHLLKVTSDYIISIYNDNIVLKKYK